MRGYRRPKRWTDTDVMIYAAKRRTADLQEAHAEAAERLRETLESIAAGTLFGAFWLLIWFFA